jgi:hypothetical protein
MILFFFLISEFNTSDNYHVLRNSCFLVYSEINKTFVPKVPHFLEGTPFKDVVMLEKYF